MLVRHIQTWAEVALRGGISDESVRLAVKQGRAGRGVLIGLSKALEVTLDYLAEDRPVDSEESDFVARHQSFLLYTASLGLEPSEAAWLWDIGISANPKPLDLREWELVYSVAKRPMQPRLVS